MTGQREHFGTAQIWNSSLGIRFYECWCGERWITRPSGGILAADMARRWCPSAPVMLGALPSREVLLMSITEAAAVGAQPFMVRANIAGSSTAVAWCANLPRALIVAHTFYKTYAASPGWTEILKEELLNAR